MIVSRPKASTLPVFFVSSLNWILGRLFEIRVHESGNEFLRAIQGRRPDVVLIDESADLEGYEICRRVRERPECRHLPILITAPLEDDESIEQAFEAGATDLILKPVHDRRLLQRVRCAVQGSRNLARLQREEVKNRALIASVPGLVVRVDQEGRVLEAVRGRIEGDELAADTFVSRNLCDLFPDQAVQILDAIVTSRERAAGAKAIGLRGRGLAREYEARFTPCGCDQYLAVFETAGRHEVQGRSDARVFRDDLTGLPNRAFFVEILQRALRSAQREEKPLATLFVGIDGFKSINETLGHHVGDELLREASRRMSECLRSSDWLARSEGQRSDSASARIGRLGGDEFCILLKGLSESSAAATVALRILNSLSDPFSCSGTEVRVTASIGIALWPDDSADGEELLRHADSAMRHAKARRRGGFEFYSTSIGRSAQRQLEVEVNLRGALDRDEFDVHYQPLVELGNGRIVGAEALLRWTPQALGPVPPDEFIPIAERTGLIAEIGDWVLQRACRDAVAWQSSGLGEVPVCVNVSGVQFRRRRFTHVVESILEEVGLDPRLLVLELTETTLMHDPDLVAACMERLRRAGARFAIDDFGTGYSSLSYVRNLPLDTIKLDGSFLEGVPKAPQSEAIAAAVLGMASGLDLTLVAEGVETDSQRQFLLDVGYELGQGHLFGHAVSYQELVGGSQ